jgi:hypothetical protein
MKAAKVEIPTVEFKIWCERCSIRIAPNEERTIVAGKIYHPQCYLKLFPSGAGPNNAVKSSPIGGHRG